jgi:hypothetical protein
MRGAEAGDEYERTPSAFVGIKQPNFVDSDLRYEVSVAYLRSMGTQQTS